ncbi:hypothetical protein Tco_0359464 [Tanacetum coccineum]
MAALKFASSHNMVAFLDKPTKSDGFEQIVDFLNAHPIKYALTVNPTIYTSCIEQFWTTAKVKTVNEEVQIQALVDKKKAIIRDKYKKQGKDFSGRDTSLFPTMIVQAQEQVEPITDDTENVASVPTHSNDPLLSGEDRLKLNELIELCTSLSQRVLDLEKTKTSQAAKITELKKRVKKLEGKRKSKPPGMKRLFKIGRSAQVVSSEDESLGDQEDASKQGRKIANIDADVEVTLINETQGRNNEEMFDTGILDGEEVFAEQDVVKKEVSIAEVAIDSATTTFIDELTLTQTLIEIKAAKPKAVTTAATTTTTAVTRPKARGVVVQEPNYELAARLQAEEQEELTIEERTEGSSKRVGEELESENLKKQKLDENVEDKVDDDQEEAEMKQYMEIVLNDEVAIDAIPLATKPPIIVDRKIIKEGKMGYCQNPIADDVRKRQGSEVGYGESVMGVDLRVMFELAYLFYWDQQPPIVNVDPKDWFKKSERPPTPDPEWNEEKPLRIFDDLMSTSIDFNAFVMNRLHIRVLTQDILVGLTYNIHKGTYRSYVELDYNMEECYKALTDQLDWNNPEGDRYPFDFSKPLPLVMSGNRRIISVDYFFNNDLA